MTANGTHGIRTPVIGSGAANSNLNKQSRNEMASDQITYTVYQFAGLTGLSVRTVWRSSGRGRRVGAAQHSQRDIIERMT